MMPLLVDGQWRNAALLNSVDYDGEAWALYRDDRLPARLGYRSWSERFPSGSPTTDAMPKANVATTWGDYLVLGDIVWNANPSAALSEENSARYPHGLWFSEPGALTSWDPLEVQFVGQRSGGNRIVGLFPIEGGLMVASTSGMYMLRGSPNENDPDELRVGVGPKCDCSVAYWPLVGSVVWLDARGQVWQTNGESFDRLDGPLPPNDPTWPTRLNSLGVLDNHLVVSRAGRLFALRAERGGGAWTELNGPRASRLRSFRGSLYSYSDEGMYRWGPEVRTQYGHRDGAPIEQRIGTATLPGDDPHERAFWHRFGARMSGGKLLSATSKAGPWLSGADALTVAGPELGDERDLAVWPGHGPSTEASFGVLTEGNVRFESLTVWLHQGRAAR